MGLHLGGNILAFTQTMAISHNIQECTRAGSVISPAQLIKSYTFITAKSLYYLCLITIGMYNIFSLSPGSSQLVFH